MNALNSTNAPAALGPYSQALVQGDMVFCSGQIPLDPATGEMAQGIENQTRQVLKNLTAVLAENGMTLANVIKTTVFLADLNDFAAMNQVYAQHFTQPFPARSCVQVAAIPKGSLVEIECIAVK